MKHLIFLILVTLLTGVQNSFAGLQYNFNTKLYFRHDGTLSPGVMEGYTLAQNDKVRLLITLLENKSFIEEIANMSDEAIKVKFLKEASDVDPLNAQSERKLISFIRQNIDGKSIIRIRYQMMKEGESWVEANTYVISTANTGMISLQYPMKISSDLQRDLSRDIDTFDLIEGAGKKTVFEKFKTQYGGLYGRVAFQVENRLDTILSSGQNLLISSAFADIASSKYKACNQKGFVLKGEFTTRKGSALFSFNKIVREIKDEVTKVSSDEANGKKPNQTRLDCLMDFYEEAKQNATDYWAQRGAEEGCLVDDDIVAAPTETCTAATLDGMKKSFAYLDEIDDSLQDFIEDKNPIKLTCAQITVVPSTTKGEVGGLAKTADQLHKNACCNNGAEDGEPGPLFSVLESENENFRTASPQAQYQMCIRKTVTDPKKKFISNEGIKECASRVLDGAVNMLVSALKSIASLFDLETWKAVGQMILHPVDTVTSIVSGLVTEITNQIKSVTSCMSPYEAKMYACQKVPEVAALVFGGGMVKKLAQALVSKASKTALGQLFTEAVSKSKTIQRIKRTATTVKKVPGRAAGKVGEVTKRTIYKSRFIKRSARAMGKLRGEFGEKVKIPLKEAVLAKMRELKQAGVTVKTRVSDAIVSGRNSLQSTVVKKGAVETADAVTAPTGRITKMTVEEGAAARAGALDATPNANGVYTVKDVAPAPTPTLRLSRVETRALPAPKADVASFREAHVSDIERYTSARVSGDTVSAESIQRSMLARIAKVDETLGVDAGNRARLEIAESITGKKYLTPDGKPTPEGNLILEAHNIGDGRGFKVPGGNNTNVYTTEDLLAKGRLLDKAGITDPKMRRTLMESGVTGNAARDASEMFQDARSSAMKGRELSGKMRDGAPITLDQVQTAFKEGAQGYEVEALRMKDAQFVGEAWRLYSKAGDASNTIRMMGVGIKDFGMNAKAVAASIDQRLVTLEADLKLRPNPALLLERDTLKKVKVEVAQKMGGTVPAPVVKPAAPAAPVKPVEPPKVVAPEVKPEVKPAAPAAVDYSAVPPRKAQDIANEYRLGTNGKAKDAGVASRYYYRASDESIAKEAARFRKSNGESEFLRDRNLSDAFDQSLASDGEIAIKVLDDINAKAGSRGVNAFIMENSQTFNTGSKSAVVRENRRKFIEHIKEKYKGELYGPQESYLRSWTSANSEAGW